MTEINQKFSSQNDQLNFDVYDTLAKISRRAKIFISEKNKAQQQIAEETESIETESENENHDE